MSERDTQGRRLYRTWAAYSRSLGHTVLPWHRLGRMREAWRLVGDAAAGIAPAAVDELDLDSPFDEGADE